MISTTHRPTERLQYVFLLAVCLAVGAPAADLPNLAHAAVYRADAAVKADISAYWVSEKLDGVRAFWDGHTLFFRSGRVIHAPGWFTQGLPATPLDGELWMARGQFERLAACVRKTTPDDAQWRTIRYMLFDLPGTPGDFTQRVEVMRTLVDQAALPHLDMVQQFRVADAVALQAALQRVILAGGEGLMLHRADAPYRAGRSDDLLKLKPWDDAEAVVLAHLPGRGQHAGQTGALRVRLADGREIRIGSGLSAQQRHTPPPIGSVITYRYRGLTASGLPRFATFLRVRETF